ncbi:MAG: gamma-glutamyltransferase [Armatimonadota bacterium]|nr:gamma-glutamyltransferase [Armatimonadota bacterium]
MHRIVALALAVAFAVIPSWAGAATVNPIATGRTGMVASATPLATEIGLQILRAGGNAVDAAVATAFALGVAEPAASGLGGGGFILIRLANGQVAFIDYREVAPKAATPTMYLGPDGKVIPNATVVGHLAVGVPGTLAGLTLALRSYGTMSLRQVLAPSIALAERGYPVPKTMAGLIKDNIEKLNRFPAARAIYTKDGLPYEVGDHIVLRDLAKSYRLIASGGPDVFYKGEIADAIAAEMRRGGGLITKEDLAAYRPKLRDPVRSTYRGYEIISSPPPSSGGTHVIEALNILEDFNIAQSGFNTPQTLHLITEALKRSFADRAKYMADPDFVKVPVAGLTSKEYAATLRRTIDLTKATAVAPGDPAPYDKPANTSHISVVDRHGNLVALTQTINYFFASGVVVPGYGIMLNDEMDDFVPTPGSANSVEPGKRPLSSMAPTLVLRDGRPFLTIGTPGATRIISALSQILMNIIDHKMDIQSAIEAPRIHAMTRDIFLEARIPEDVRAALRALGHPLQVRGEMDLYFGGAQGIMIAPNGVLFGGADPRRDGFAKGLWE